MCYKCREEINKLAHLSAINEQDEEVLESVGVELAGAYGFTREVMKKYCDSTSENFLMLSKLIDDPKFTDDTIMFNLITSLSKISLVMDHNIESLSYWLRDYTAKQAKKN